MDDKLVIDEEWLKEEIIEGLAEFACLLPVTPDFIAQEIVERIARVAKPCVNQCVKSG